MNNDFEQYVAARTASLLTLAYLLTRDSHLAEDVVQEVLGRAHGRWATISRAQNVHAYVRRMVVNETVSRFRRRRVLEVFRPPEHFPEPQVATAETRLDDAELVWRTLARLPPRQRAVLVLRFYEDLSDTEIAETLSIAPGTVRGLASRGIANLRSQPALRDYTSSTLVATPTPDLRGEQR